MYRKLSLKGDSFHMAKKGQKQKKYTDEIRKKVLEEYFSGRESYLSLSQKYDIPYKTVDTWIYKARFPERFPGAGTRKGRKKDSEIDWKERYEILKKYQTFLKAQRERK